MVAAAIERAHGDHMAALLLRGEEHGGEGRHAAGEGHGFFRAFELRERAFEPGHGGVVEALVDGGADGQPAHRLGFEAAPALVQVGQRVGAGEVDGQRVDAQVRKLLAAGVDGAGGEGKIAGMGHGSPLDGKRAA